MIYDNEAQKAFVLSFLSQIAVTVSLAELDENGPEILQTRKLIAEIKNGDVMEVLKDINLPNLSLTPTGTEGER